MKAISTRYLGPTNYVGARIKADDGDSNSVTIGYPHEYDSEKAHAQAALALVRKMGWGKMHTHLIAGSTRTGFVFVFATNPDDTYNAYKIGGAS